MDADTKYITKQHEAIKQHFENNPSMHFTAHDVLNALNNKGYNIGLATVYRQLKKLQNADVIRKYALINNSSACYEYCGSKDQNYHLKCSCCGELFHINCDMIDDAIGHIKSDHSFKIDCCQTVFYGECKKCNNHE